MRGAGPGGEGGPGRGLREGGGAVGRGLCRAVMRPRGPGRRPSVRLSGGGLKDMKVSVCGGAGGERPQVGGVAGAFERGRGAGGAGSRYDGTTDLLVGGAAR